MPEPRRPEPDAVSCTDGLEESVYLVVLEQRRLKICVGANMRSNQVIAVHRGWRGDRVPTREHELQQRHLGCRVLHRHAVRPNLQVAFQRRARSSVDASSRWPKSSFSASVSGRSCRSRTMARRARMRAYASATSAGVDSITVTVALLSRPTRPIFAGAYARPVALPNYRAFRQICGNGTRATGALPLRSRREPGADRQLGIPASAAWDAAE